MEQNGQQNTNPPQPPANPGVTHGRVLQPSESFVAEMKAAQLQPTPERAPTISQTVQAPPSAEIQPPVRPVAPSSSIYPDPTSGVGVSNSAPLPPVDEPAPTNNNAKVLAVRVVAGGIILLNAINAYNWLVGGHVGLITWLNVIGIGLGLILAIGMFLLKETARVTYVYLSALLLGLSIIGIVLLYISFNSLNHPGTSAYANSHITKSDLQKSVGRYNPTLTPAQNAQIQKDLQNEIASAPSDSSSVNIKQYLTDGLLLVVAIFPLVFFTRPSIKQVFR